MSELTEEEKIIRNIMGGIWKTNSVSTEPAIELVKWNVFAVLESNGVDYGCHINGYSTSGYEGRVSSKIMAFDKETMIGTTRSGRQYRLTGPPGFDGDASYVRDRWLSINKLTEEDVTDVTGEYLTNDDIQSSDTGEV